MQFCRWRFSRSTALRVMTVSSRFKDRFSFKSSSKQASGGIIWVDGLMSAKSGSPTYFQVSWRIWLMSTFASFKHFPVIIITENISPQHPLIVFHLRWSLCQWSVSLSLSSRWSSWSALLAPWFSTRFGKSITVSQFFIILQSRQEHSTSPDTWSWNNMVVVVCDISS